MKYYLHALKSRLWHAASWGYRLQPSGSLMSTGFWHKIKGIEYLEYFAFP